MNKIVIDTNILVSSLLNSLGSSAKIMALVSFKELQLFYNQAILVEYKRVLAYERLKFSVQTQNNAIENIEELGVIIEPTASVIPMPDETDRIFYDAAKTAEAILITGNIKHYPTELFIMLPADFVKTVEK